MRLTRMGKRVGASCALAAMLGAICANAAAQNAVIARGGSVELGEQDVRAAIALMPSQAQTNLRTNAGMLTDLVRSELIERAIIEEARAAHFDTESSTRAHLEQSQRKALANLWIATKATPPADYPSDAQIRAAYEQQVAATPTEYHLAQIFIRAPNAGNARTLSAALAKVTQVTAALSTAEFAALARQYSDDAATARSGGDSGFLRSEQLLADVQDAVKALQPGQVAGPIKSSAGFHFLKLLEKRPITPLPYERVRDRLRAELRSREQRDLENLYVRELTDRLNITIDQSALQNLRASLD